MINRVADKSLLPQTSRDWNSLIAELRSFNIEIIEFISEAIDRNHWAMLISPTTKTKKEGKVKGKYFNKRINSYLEKGLKLSGKEASKYWEDVLSEIQLRGFCIPINDIQKIELNVLKSHLYFYKYFIKLFPYQDFFLSLSNVGQSSNINGPISAHFMWLYILYYSRFLHQLRLYSDEAFEEYGSWFSNLLDLDNFHSRLPSEQITILLLNLSESLVADTEHQWQQKRKYSRGSLEVNSFFNKFEIELNSLFKDSDSTFGSDNLSETHEKIKQEFAEIFLKDQEVMLLQEVLDNLSGLSLSRTLSLKLQLRYGPNSLFNVSGVIKDKIYNFNKAFIGLFKEDDPRIPNYKSEQELIYPKNVQYWYDLTYAERKKIIDILDTRSDIQLIQKGQVAVEMRCNNHWLNLINLISAPILVWKYKSKNLIPQFNLLEDAKERKIRKTFKQREADKEKERKLLEQYIEAILDLESMKELKEFRVNHNPVFSYQNFHKSWNDELKRAKDKFQQRENYHNSRMKEFGILESNITKEEKEEYLYEMLRIEDEVRPYITYVKKAFQSALPMRKTSTFSHYRHASDGIVFDAETLFDQEKWIRAEVMKVMESKVQKGEAIQINTFCLDYSGSMHHDRMRNLFKILYLLVLGLEDRKSFDAFHFFSNRFIEVLDFSEEFTSRKVLFKIMKQISTLDLGRVTYSGEGMTNISEGIRMSHAKMKNFVQEFRKYNPEANIVTSIFVITDGEPTMGITTVPDLNKFVENKRQDGDVEIKGIFINSEDDLGFEFMEDIFGKDHFIEAGDFKEGVNKFVKIMTETYKQQRMTYKWKQRKRKLGLTE